jgi:hypothetical protein
MGDIIVSDPYKLSEVSAKANCAYPCGGPPFDEYATSRLGDAVELADLGLQRTIYQHLVPLSFPAYDLGLTENPDPQTNLTCGFSDDPPFGNEGTGGPTEAPRRSYSISLDEWHPSFDGSRVRVQILVHRDLGFWSWPDSTLLDRMFDPVNEIKPATGGLGMDRRDFIREATSRFDPSHICTWGD